MPAVRRCKDTQSIEELRLGEDRRLFTGTVRRYVTCEGGRPVLIQLPTCYTPAGLLSDFDEGARLTLIPIDSQGREEMASLLQLCHKILEKTHSDNGSSEYTPAATSEPKLLIDNHTGEISVATSRVRDVRVFEAEDLAADDCPILPGDTVTAIISPDYYWRSASGQKHGLSIRLVQVLLHTDRGRYKYCLWGSDQQTNQKRVPAPAPPPPPPPPMPHKRNHRPENTAQTRPVKSVNFPIKDQGFRPTVMEIVTARNALRKTTKGNSA